jgi:hypothetical protein
MHDPEAEGGLLSVLRSHGLGAAIATPCVGATDAPPQRGVSPRAERLPAHYQDSFDDSEEGVDIGEEIREMKDPISKFEALTKKFQINLNDSDQLRWRTGLEDPRLVMHTATRRQRLLEIEKEMEELPTEEYLSAEDVKGRRALSALVTTLEEAKTLLDCESSTLFGIANNCPPNLSKKLKGSCTQLDAIVEQLRQAQISLTTARRSCEVAIDGTKRRSEYYKSECQREEQPSRQPDGLPLDGPQPED